MRILGSLGYPGGANPPQEAPMTSLRRALRTASTHQKAASPRADNTVRGAWTEPEPPIVLDDVPETRVLAQWQRHKEVLVDYVDAVRADLHWDTRSKMGYYQQTCNEGSNW